MEWALWQIASFSKLRLRISPALRRKADSCSWPHIPLGADFCLSSWPHLGFHRSLILASGHAGFRSVSWMLSQYPQSPWSCSLLGPWCHSKFLLSQFHCSDSHSDVSSKNLPLSTQPKISVLTFCPCPLPSRIALVKHFLYVVYRLQLFYVLDYYRCLFLFLATPT